MSIAHEMMEKFLKELSASDAEAAVHHIRQMVSQQSYRAMAQFMKLYENENQLDNILIGLCAALISSIPHTASALDTDSQGLTGVQVAKISISELRKLADHIEKEVRDVEKHLH